MPAMSPQSNGQWMVAYVTHDLPDAYVVAGRLEHHRIPTLVHYTPGAGALGIHIGTLGAVYVLVHPRDYDLAMAIIDPDAAELPHSTGLDADELRSTDDDE